MKYLLLFLLSSAALASSDKPKHLVCRDGKKVIYSVYGDIKKTKGGYVIGSGDRVIIVAVTKKYKCTVEK